ncbi:hypothetical protein TTHERM_00035060 (macronuclear) [Tetrahymena thermophila SB210]|uniref:Uncharacterized protein n=1 Tax=Tetrahymena thermophila (strain SB210) TaxID=312017 RepID=Q22ML3_TETTS|nr:hypothetical protein TTHERM_00035060 [Tetrahymena thermophila SB210]EAR86674.2 hypothetical protein TTHERM_00035060 [Tetrahymena thermophila SB210]|eukprot:XP_977007.2 hypothetical protein TTHERM_00035060 [Tetrahymena thermophila SB210]
MFKNIISFQKGIQNFSYAQSFFKNNNLYFFASKKKEKIVKLNRHVETLEDQLLKKKKEEFQKVQKAIVEKNKNNINNIPFDELTIKMKQENIALQQLQAKNNKNQTQIPLKEQQKDQTKEVNSEGTIFNESQLKILVTDKDKYLDFENLEFPWDFQGINQQQKESNLKSAIEITKIINEKTAISILKQFLHCIEEFDYEQLGEFVERKFLRQLSKRLQAMQQEKIKIQFDNIRTKEINVDLFKVQNIFGVGVEQNRRKNDGSSAYVIFDDFIQQQIPAKHIVKKRIEPKELARIYVQLHLSFESDISLSLINTEKGTKKQDKIAKNESTKQYHTMILEKLLVECDYKSIRNKALSLENATNQIASSSNVNDYINVSNMKNFASLNNLKIIDFDGFMKGNPLVVDNLDID